MNRSTPRECSKRRRRGRFDFETRTFKIVTLRGLPRPVHLHDQTVGLLLQVVRRIHDRFQTICRRRQHQLLLLTAVKDRVKCLIPSLHPSQRRAIVLHRRQHDVKIAPKCLCKLYCVAIVRHRCKHNLLVFLEPRRPLQRNPIVCHCRKHNLAIVRVNGTFNNHEF